MAEATQDGNGEALRTQSFRPRISSALSASQRFKFSPDAYKDIPSFCKSASLDEIAKHGYVLTPGRYVGAEEVEDDSVPFAEKMEGLTRELATQFLNFTSPKNCSRRSATACTWQSLKGTALVQIYF